MIKNLLSKTGVIALLVLAAAMTVCCSAAAQVDPTAIQDKIAWLNTRLMKRYWSKDQDYVFPIYWQHQKGIFESRVHFNMVDKKNSDLTAWFRDDYFKIDDINMFVTNFVLYGLLEARELGTIKVNEHMVSQALMAIAGFRDKNAPEGVPQYAFWPQVNVNGTWSAQAINLVHSVNLVPAPPSFLDGFLTKNGLGILTQVKNIAKAFVIPGDNDDSSVNLALLGLLKQTKSEHFQFWNSLNLKKQQYYDRVLKYAYRPFSVNSTLNRCGDEIDPRTYFVLREFLDYKYSRNQTLILPTTWLINSDEEVEGLVIMPFKSNNVDASVCANVLFGLTYQIITGQVQLNDQLKQMMLDITELIEFTVKKILLERPTLILVYYPSKYDFYWFVARIVSLLKRYPDAAQPLPEIKKRLETLTKKIVTQQIIQTSQKDPEGGLFWQEFLGNFGDKNRREDVIFSSSMALNALLDTWTTRSGSTLTIDSDLPEQVHQVLVQGVEYLMANLKPKMKELNAFFSGSMKLFDSSFPYFFPSNVAVDKGKTIDPTQSSIKDITFSMRVHAKGYIKKQQYEEMLQKNWFGHEVPVKEVSFNSEKGLGFPFWSSRAITEVMAISSLSKFLKVYPGLAQPASHVRRQSEINQSI